MPGRAALCVVMFLVVGCGGQSSPPPQTRAVRVVAGSTGADTTRLLGHSVQGRPIRLTELGRPGSRPVVLVVGCIHGNECAGEAVTRRLREGSLPARGRLLVIDDLDPDGHARGSRLNARGVDLNRNFPSEWRARGVPFDLEYPGPRPSSEPETRIAQRLIRRERPDVTIWFHQPQHVVRAWGPSVSTARRYARLAGASFRRLRWPTGTAPNWQNHAFPGTASFVVELAPGVLRPRAARRYASAARALLRG